MSYSQYVRPQTEGPDLALDDWRRHSSQHADVTTVVLPDGSRLVVDGRRPAIPQEISDLSDDSLIFVYNVCRAPIVTAEMFLRGLSDHVGDVAQMLAHSEFYTAVGPLVSTIIGNNLDEDPEAWAAYYATALREFPIFKLAVDAVDEHHQSAIADCYLAAYNDIRYLSPSRIQELDVTEKAKILLNVVVAHESDTGRRGHILSLFSETDTLDIQVATEILLATTNSASVGSLMNSPLFVTDRDIANNTLSVWISHCLAEGIGCNSSVWYKRAQEIEAVHGFEFTNQYYVAPRSGAIGGLSNDTGDTQLISGGRSGYGEYTPIGL